LDDYVKQYILISIIAVLAVIVLVFSDFGNTTRVYDCGMAEWHPDIPAEVKTECRKLRNLPTREKLITV
jgi:hypothetical protein